MITEAFHPDRLMALGFDLYNHPVPREALIPEANIDILFT